MKAAFPEPISWLSTRLQQSLPGSDAHSRMMARVRELPAVFPKDARASAVLCLLFYRKSSWRILLMKRTEDGTPHSGQICFPGGRKEQFDSDLRATALREAQEEVGILSSEVQIIGALTHLYIPVSNFLVYPFVGYAENAPVYNLSSNEVARVVEMPLEHLLASSEKIITTVTSPADASFKRSVNAYRLGGEPVWGATAMILSELEVILSENTQLLQNRENKR